MRALLFAAALIAAASNAAAGPPTLSGVVISEARDGPAKSTFKPATAKVHIRAKLVDVPPGAKVKGEWIAARVEGVPINFKIDSVVNTVGIGATQYHGALSKPSAGWPLGEYRVDLFIDGRPVQRGTFRVAK